MHTRIVINKKSLFLSVVKLWGILFLLTLLIELANVDRYVADYLYQWEGNRWQLKNAWFTATFIHKGGKYLSIALLLFVLLLFIALQLSPTFTNWRCRLAYLLTATLLGVLFVNVGKSISNISCPWDFSRYGGTQEYLSLMEQLWVRNGSQCFPAGHASAGFAWVSLYFIGRHTAASWRWPALFFALSLGVVFGVSQQLRGAHFLSHDLWSFGICWMTSFICYEVMLKPYEPAK